MTDTATKQLHDWIAEFQTALQSGDIAAALELFAPEECFWRDLAGFSWNLVTLEGRAAIEQMLRAQLPALDQVSLTADGAATVAGSEVEGWFRFATRDLRGAAHVRMRDGKCYTLLTAGEELVGFEEPIGERRPDGAGHKATKGRRTWSDERDETARTLGHSVQPYCLIIGGGQGGLALAARLKRLNVPTLIVDMLERPGDAWRSRYKSLYLHDPIWMDHLPYLPFPKHWPVYTAKDKMGDWLEAYAKIMELDFWGSTTCRKAAYDEQDQCWTVTVERGGEAITLRPRQLVLATGLSGIKQRPDFPGAELFRGLQYHSSEHPGEADFAGKRCVVIGANNSAHDIAADLWEKDADVTMIQRSPTTVMKADTLRQFAEKGDYADPATAAGMTTERADLLGASRPFRLRIAPDRAICEQLERDQADFYERLTAAGFLYDFGDDGTGIAGKYHQRASGYYIDVGASDLIADGEIKIRSRCGVQEIRGNAVVLTSGEELPADVIVYATGYGPMNGWAEMLISKEVADKIGPCWGLGSGQTMDPGPWEGELRNMWKPTAQEGLWFHGGNLLQSRFHSLHLALQLKARMEGIATPVFQTS